MNQELEKIEIYLKILTCITNLLSLPQLNLMQVVHYFILITNYLINLDKIFELLSQMSLSQHFFEIINKKQLSLLVVYIDNR